jgi:hypothetical protein
MQSLSGRSHWGALRDVVRGDTRQAIGDAVGVQVVDETRFLKKGAFGWDGATIFRHGRPD